MPKNNIPFGSAPTIYSPNLMTGKLISVTPIESTSDHQTTKSDINLVDDGSRRLVGSDFPTSEQPKVSASDLQNDPERSWINLFAPKQVFPTTPKTMDSPPPEPPLPQTRDSSWINLSPFKNVKYSVLKNEDDGFFDSLGTKFNDLTHSVGVKWDNATPMERGLAIGIPTALAAGAGALYLRKKQREANRSSKK